MLQQLDLKNLANPQQDRITNDPLAAGNLEDAGRARQTVLDIPPQQPSEFQNFIHASTGQWLPIYGSDLFTGSASTFAPAERVPVSADYLIGPGDEIVVKGWGQVDIDYKAIVDRQGNIFIPRVGTINLAGIKYSQLQEYLRNQIGRIYRNFDLTVSMGQLRSMQVLIVGQAKRPGTYTLSSLSTLVSALFASGGSSSRGSMRSIQLKRAGKLVVDFDLYDLLLRGEKTNDPQLLAGDVLYIPPVGNQVALTGSVQMPGIYELRGNSTVRDVIAFAGGLTPTADLQNATFEHLGGGKRSVDDLALDQQGLSHPVSNGDIITVRSMSSRFSNAVTLRGNVAVPGRFAWREGMTVKDLVPSREALITKSFWQKQTALTIDPADQQGDKEYEKLFGDPREKRLRDQRLLVTPLTDKEIAALNESKQAGDSHSATVPAAAAVDQKRLQAEISDATPTVNWDYAVIQRIDSKDLSTRLLPFNLGKAIEGDPESNLVLAPGDVVTVFSQADFKVAESRRTKFVRLEGEFATAGIYELRPGETLNGLVQRVGGITPSAYLYGSEFSRESARRAQQERLDEFSSRLELDVERSAAAKSQNVVAVEEAAGLREQADSQRRLAEKFKALRATGRVVLGLKPTDLSADALPDIVLEDGDRLFIPYKPATVNVIGAVYSENSYVADKDRAVGYYLRRAGGGTKSADRAHAFIIRADGSLVSKSRASSWFSNSFDDVRVMPGDTIVVPEQLNRVGLLKGLKDWSQVLAQFGLGAAAIRTLSR